MDKKEENTPFICLVCQRHVTPLQNGSYRNHCPFCLWSLHVDDAVPGDRKSRCYVIMRPCVLRHNGKKGWQIVHKCMKCGAEKLYKIAEDAQSDDSTEIVRLSQENI